ncbi:cysteine/serine-rich nuclear protein 1 [Engraulis encrasicolus]|uniref:cysteine/serine-rich nuclear protein 1 n=1 Tax=Engraulis encrasicolus TaxID=184585 RepID=UPI002FCE941C
MSRDLKRKFEDSDEDHYCTSSSSSPSPSSPPSSSSSPSVHRWDLEEQEEEEENTQKESPDRRLEPTPHTPHSASSLSSVLRSAKPKRVRRKGRVHFGAVTVFHFQRCQGFTSVPSHGGCTLGMERRHSSYHRYSLAEHRVEQRRQRREKLRDKLREEALKMVKQKLLNSGSLTREEAQNLTLEDVPEVQLAFNSVDKEEEEEEEVKDNNADGAEENDEGYLPFSYTSKQRRRLLQRAGVTCIDREEKRELQELRRWRQDCGCHCQGFCEPLTCACSLAGIQCQMDRSSFPCDCSRDTCGNPAGRVEFNAGRVQTHYIHTLMRLELERRRLDDRLQRRHPMNEEEEEEDDNVGGRRGSESGQGTLSWLNSSVDDTLLSLESCATTPPLTPLFPAPGFIIGAEVTAEGENSWSSDMTDSSCFSMQSRDSGADLDTLTSTQDHRDMGQDVLSLGLESDDDLPFSIDGGDHSLCLENNREKALSLTQMSTSVFLDENANQTDAMFPYEEALPDPPHTPSPSIGDSSESYMDPSLSSCSSLEFFDDLHDYHASPAVSHLREYSSYLSDGDLCSLTGHGFHQGEDMGTQLLESLIGVA